MNYKPTWDLSTIPDNIWASELGRRCVARRVRPSGGARPGAGRPKKLAVCQACGSGPYGYRELRAHKCSGEPLPAAEAAVLRQDWPKPMASRKHSGATT